jgi:hypothetical protein
VHEGHEWRDAPRLVATVQQQNEYNDLRLNDFTDVVHLVASHAYINPRGVVARDDAIPDTIRRQIPQDIDNCGGLAETVQYVPRPSRSTTVTVVFQKVCCMPSS